MSSHWHTLLVGNKKPGFKFSLQNNETWKQQTWNQCQTTTQPSFWMGAKKASIKCWGEGGMNSDVTQKWEGKDNKWHSLAVSCSLYKVNRKGMQLCPLQRCALNTLGLNSHNSPWGRCISKFPLLSLQARKNHLCFLFLYSYLASKAALWSLYCSDVTLIECQPRLH